MDKYNKIKLYRENLINFIKTQDNKIILLEKINEIDYLIGILFLTEMNRYCKNNNISIHGYYIAYSFINFFSKIRKKLIKSYKLNYNDLNHFWISLANNIDYLNNRVNNANNIKDKINNNLSKLIIILNPYFFSLINYKNTHKDDILMTHINISINSNSSIPIIDKNKYDEIYCDKKCYICCIDEILKKFLYVLLFTAKFMGSGDIKPEPNLLKLAEYYANIFYTYIKLNDKNNIPTCEVFDNYTNYKNRLVDSIIELKIQSATIDELLDYLDKIISKKNI
jgi:hypothetical protein